MTDRYTNAGQQYLKLETVVLTSAEDFVRELSPIAPRWGAAQPDWVFRGQRRADWGLIPSAYRPGVFQKWLRAANGDPRTRAEQICCEALCIEESMKKADAQGLEMHWGDSELHEWVMSDWWPRYVDRDPSQQCLRDSTKRQQGETWPTKGLLAVVARMQHEGLPTRLLDWSRNPLIAAYFACEGVANERFVARQGGGSPAPGHLSVWALKRRGQGSNVTDYGVRVVGTPRATNPNLHLQTGLFTWHLEDTEDIDTPESNQDLARYLLDHAGVDLGVLMQFTLPWSEAGRLLRVLHEHFVHGTQVYAGYRGVIASMQEALCWE